MAALRRKSSRVPALFRKILVANRGEIAVRVIRACRQLGIQTVAVCSEADRKALHVRMADESVPIGPPPSAASYLNIPAVLDAAERTGAEAIHPGYGFLAENPEFAQACADSGVVFVGPPAAAMRRLGNKIEGRRRMAAAGVPVIPGLVRKNLTTAELERWARKAGYPFLLKAAAGGGGRGMRIVRAAGEIESALAASRGEAKSAFGDETVFAERYFESARHIEIQVLVDADGRGISLGERECSLQRRHQKLVEESPSPVVTEAERRRLGRYALRACEAAGYRNAGTVEFLRDRNGRFHFLEMNARLQVEHPVTEAVTGVDLVQAQIRIAAGAPLVKLRHPLRPRGWAVECRIQAEDPDRDFLPCPGMLKLFRPPAGPRIRVDAGVAQGDEVPPYYDSLLAKLIAWGTTREQALETMAAALAEFRVAGVRTTIPFHRRVMADPEFRRGEIDTHSVERMMRRELPAVEEAEEVAALVAAAHLFAAGRLRTPAEVTGPDPWTLAGRRGMAGRSALRDPWARRDA